MKLLSQELAVLALALPHAVLSAAVRAAALDDPAELKNACPDYVEYSQEKQ